MMHHRLLSLLLLACLLAVSGCSGCRPEAAQSPDAKSPAGREAGKESEKKKAEPFVSGELRVLPADETLAAYGAKPGHWVSLRNEWTSLQLNSRLELTVAPAGLDGQPVPFGNSGYTLEYSRPVVLPKGQKKTFELPCFVPRSDATALPNRNVVMASELRAGGVSVHDKGQLTNRLRAHQMHLVVLARRPDSFAYLKSLETVRPPDMGGIEVYPDYIPVFPAAKPPVLLPSSSLMWSSIACVVWEDFDPALLSREQQEAMVEWLHWGGQLLVSGPASMDALGQSFLAGYLPVRGGRIEKMSQPEARELDVHWSRSLADGQKEPGFPWSEQSALDVLRWTAADLGPVVPPGEASRSGAGMGGAGTLVPGTANLVAESRVGRGRIVVTAFSLSARPVVVWKSFDNFVNGCLLRRPGRSFPTVDRLEAVRVSDRWAELLSPLPTVSESEPPGLVDESPERSAERGLLNSRLRYFARDASVLKDGQTVDQAGHWELSGYDGDPESGVAGWSDLGHVGQVAVADLNRTAGINVPDARLVLRSLAAYLLILVPVNWGLFRALNRVEWAWLAVPVLALLGTFAVVRVARLDIGFSRSVTEIAVVEMQQALPRAHVTRFTGIYTALSEPFDLVFDQESSLALPILDEFQGRAVELVDRRRPLPLKRTDRLGENLVLEGLAIGSNSTAMVRSEQVVELPGVLRFESENGQWSDATGTLRNGTGLALRGVVAMRRNARGVVEYATCGDVDAGGSTTVRFEPLPLAGLPDGLWNDSNASAPSSPDSADKTGPATSTGASLRVRHLLTMAANPSRIYTGDVKVLAWMGDRIEGMKVRPETTEVNFRGILLSHLHYGTLPPPDSDDNGPSNTVSEDDHD